MLKARLSGYRNPYFSSQYTGATNVGIIRGSYHFARPDISSGAAQARFFLANGGVWTADGQTLPGALDMECDALASVLFQNPCNICKP